MTSPEGFKAQHSFSELTQLLLPALSTSDLLELVVDLAITVEGVDGASVSIVHREGDRFETSNASSPELQALDEAQYDRTEGPCVRAIQTASEVTVELPAEQWPEFSERAVKGGVRSVSSLPLRAGERTLGALNLYSYSQPGLGPDSRWISRRLAAQAAVVLANSAALTVAEMTNRQLQEALATRDLIGQAKGVIMARERVDAERAFDILRHASQRTNRKLRDLAADIVAQFGDQGAPG